jgi:hypothetical protein
LICQFEIPARSPTTPPECPQSHKSAMRLRLF